MPFAPSRDRLARPVDISTLLPGAARRVNLIVDEPGLRRLGLSGYGFTNVPRNDLTCAGGSVGSPVGVQRVGFERGRIQPVTTAGNARGRGRRSQLPSWYPRTPLRDLTVIMRAIDRRRAELGLNQETEGPEFVQNQGTERSQEENDTAAIASNAQLELEVGTSTPISTVALKPEPSPAIQVLRMKPGNLNGDGSDFLTPQKKLLNSIEKVREVWLEEQRKLSKTPAAKRAEKERKVRVLMSMR